MVAAILRQLAGEPSVVRERNALVTALWRQVERALAEGRWRFADHFCDKILLEDPRNLETWLVKGHLSWHYLRDPQQAVSCFRQVLILGGFESSNAYVAQARTSLTQLLEHLA